MLPRLNIAAVLLATLLSACARPGADASAGTLAIPINLKCTTCDDFIRCSETASPAGSSTVYRLREKTFWAQIATIGDYLTQFVREKSRDERPMAMYRSGPEGHAISFDPQWRAIIDVPAARITVQDHSIDQRTGDWYDRSNRRIGQCVAMPRREGYALVREFLGKPALAGASPRDGTRP